MNKSQITAVRNLAVFGPLSDTGMLLRDLMVGGGHNPSPDLYNTELKKGEI